MASLPPRPASQRKSSPREPSPTSAPNIEHGMTHTSDQASSSTSEQYPTLLLNNPSIADSEKSSEQNQAVSPQAQSHSQPEDTGRRCWICFEDESEDGPMSSEWRSPCPCALTAHEKCLLDWIADLEAPNGARRAGGRAKITCPQCKSEIRVVRPQNAVVNLVRSLERLANICLVPGIVFVLGSAVYSTATFFGTRIVYQVFGPEDGLQVLRPMYTAPDASDRLYIVSMLNHLRHHWRLDLGLPLIPTVLVASRTTLADGFLPFLPFIFFTSSSSEAEMMRLQWPPSAAFAITALPYIRALYNSYYERVWLPRERRWLKEIQPRAGDADNDDINVDEEQLQEEERIQEAFDNDGAEVMEVEVDFDIFADWNNGGEVDNNAAEEAPPVPIARGPGRPLNAPPPHVQEAAPAPDVPQRRNRGRERNITFSTTSLADTIIGALIFPSIAAAVGEALKHVLPRSWVTPPTLGKPTGILQAKWGRSLVGGCLFVGLKDAVMLYVRWKMAQNHRQRRVLDYDRPRRRNGSA